MQFEESQHNNKSKIHKLISFYAEFKTPETIRQSTLANQRLLTETSLLDSKFCFTNIFNI